MATSDITTPQISCSRCHQVFSATSEHFNKAPGCNKYGLSAYCKACIRARRIERDEKLGKRLAIIVPDLPNEEWRDIPGAEGFYQASNFGRVKRLSTGRDAQWFRGGGLLSPRPSRGYQRVSISVGNTKDCYIHRLVMLAFVGECPDGCNVNHIDGNKQNNHLDNLEYVTFSGNSRHAFGLGLMHPAKGAQNGHVKLTEQDVREIRILLAEGLNRKEIGRRFGVTYGAIDNIASRRNWKHLE